MKKIGLICLALLSLLFVSCGGSDGKSKSEDGYMAILNENEVMWETAIQKIRAAESVRELEVIGEWIDDREHVLDDKYDAFKKNNKEQWREIHRQIESGEGVYSNKVEHIWLMKAKCEGLFETRMNEMMYNGARDTTGNRSEWGNLW